VRASDRGRKRFRPLILCYHAISEMWQDELSVAPRVFEHQLRMMLRRRLRPVPITETLSGRGRLLHVTFDDAFRSVLDAVPVLERLGVPATVFACPSFADGGRVLNVRELAGEAASHPAELATMSWDELRDLVDRGIEVGSHTLNHAHLTRLSDADLGRELSVSRERLENELGRPCQVLAYPYGEEDGRVRAAARAAGYEAAFGLPGRPSPMDLYALPRVGIWRGDTALRMRLKTSSLARRPPERVLNLLRRRTPPRPAQENSTPTRAAG
jgi:peptidoglycan/xylan/chitin deacetylase (PgdA/CDA1 family)